MTLGAESVVSVLDLSQTFRLAVLMAGDWKRLGEIARPRRKQLGLTQIDIQNAGGPSTALIRQIENGTYTADMQRALKRAYELALEWPEGSIDTILSGGSPPVVDATVEPPPATATATALPPDFVYLSDEEFNLHFEKVMTEAQRRMRQGPSRIDEVDREQENPS